MRDHIVHDSVALPRCPAAPLCRRCSLPAGERGEVPMPLREARLGHADEGGHVEGSCWERHAHWHPRLHRALLHGLPPAHPQGDGDLHVRDRPVCGVLGKRCRGRGR
eukprot:9782408-Alexandrium_andersonii.AAC.1